MTTSLPLPMGIGVDEVNAITEVDADGAGAKQGLQVGDELLWLDGIEVRDGLVSIVEALDREVVNHVVVLRRVDEIRPAAQQPDVGFAHEIGPVELQLPMVRVRVRLGLGSGLGLPHTLTRRGAPGRGAPRGAAGSRLPARCGCARRPPPRAAT